MTWWIWLHSVNVGVSAALETDLILRVLRNIHTWRHTDGEISTGFHLKWALSPGSFKVETCAYVTDKFLFKTPASWWGTRVKPHEQLQSDNAETSAFAANDRAHHLAIIPSASTRQTANTIHAIVSLLHAVVWYLRFITFIFFKIQ